jgi:acyl-CoA thioesterase FadM
MSRIKIDIPGTFPFCTIIPIRITDINYGNHVGNDSILSLIHEARVQYFHHYGLGELDFAGASLIMSDVGIEFKAELLYGDTVKAYVVATDFSRIAFNIYYKFVKEVDQSIVTLAKTGMVCFDYNNKKVIAIPEEANKKLMQS